MTREGWPHISLNFPLNVLLKECHIYTVIPTHDRIGDIRFQLLTHTSSVLILLCGSCCLDSTVCTSMQQTGRGNRVAL